MDIDTRSNCQFITGLISTARGLFLNFPLAGSGEGMTFPYPNTDQVAAQEIIRALEDEFPGYIFEAEEDSLLYRIKVIAPKPKANSQPS